MKWTIKLAYKNQKKNHLPFSKVSHEAELHPKNVQNMNKI